MSGKNATNDAAILERSKIREANAKERAQKLETLKKEANVAFGSSDYRRAAQLYADAIEAVGPKPVLLSNLAITLGKLERWEECEWAANLALEADPKMIKPRFQRGKARAALKRYTASASDFKLVVQHDLKNAKAAAAAELRDVQQQLKLAEARTPGEDDEARAQSSFYPDDTSPKYDANAVNYESDSDTEDCRHAGNGAACRFYNRGNCVRGSRCAFSHAPDSKSVRDKRGRNVCLHHLLGTCKHGDAKCSYSHRKNHLPGPAWWCDQTSISQVTRLVEDLDSETVKGNLKLEEDLLHSNPMARFVARTQVKTSISTRLATMKGSLSAVNNADLFVLILVLDNESLFSDAHASLIQAISEKCKVIQATTASDALRHLASPNLGAILVGDAHLAKEMTTGRGGSPDLLKRIVAYVKSGGNLVIGCLFVSFTNGTDFEAFFKAFGLSWSQGSYHWENFNLITSHPVATSAAPSLVGSYSMKALQVSGLSPEMIIYKGDPQSLFPFRSDSDEAPVARVKVGDGHLAYIGDVNQEEESINAYLALLNLLSPPPSLPPRPSVPAAQPIPSSSNSTIPDAAPVEPVASSIIPRPRVLESMTPPPSKNSPVAVVFLDNQKDKFTRRFPGQVDFLRWNAPSVNVISSVGDLELAVTTRSVRGIYLADAGIANASNAGLLPKLLSYVKCGGIVVSGGLFPSIIDGPSLERFFSAFKVKWSKGSSNTAVYEVARTHELKEKNPTLPPSYRMESVCLKRITMEEVVYLKAEDGRSDEEEEDKEKEEVEEEEVNSPVLRARIGRGIFGYIGDVNGSKESNLVLSAMLELLQTPPPLRESKRFVLLLSFSTGEPVETEYRDLLKNLEQKVEVIRGLSAPRMTDLISSPDLAAVLVSAGSIIRPEHAYLASKLVEFTTSGGTVVFLEDFPRGCVFKSPRPFLLDKWGLDWSNGAYSYPANEIQLNESNALVCSKSRAKGSLEVPKDPKKFGVCLVSSNPDDLVYIPQSFPCVAWDVDGEQYQGPVLYAKVEGDGHVGYLGGSTAVEGYTGLLFSMIGL